MFWLSAQSDPDFGSGRGAADGRADRLESRVGVLAKGGDGREAHHDDERQHHGVFNRGRAIFLADEIDDETLQMRQHFKPLWSRDKYATRAFWNNPEKAPQTLCAANLAFRTSVNGEAFTTR